GWGDSVGIYMDAESGHNVIARNYIHMLTNQREQVAIDGSAHNTVIENRFSGLSHGGIYLYRNCGEDGNIRHQTPSYNQIVNNVFYYDSCTGGNPAIWLASRNGNRPYCGLDDGYPYGSSAS